MQSRERAYNSSQHTSPRKTLPYSLINCKCLWFRELADICKMEVLDGFPSYFLIKLTCSKARLTVVVPLLVSHCLCQTCWNTFVHNLTPFVWSRRFFFQMAFHPGFAMDEDFSLSDMTPASFPGIILLSPGTQD